MISIFDYIWYCDHHVGTHIVPTTIVAGFTLALVDLSAAPNVEKMNVAIPGSNPVSFVEVACSSALGAQMDPRSCYDALTFAARGNQQEAWVIIGLQAQHRHRAVPGSFNCLLLFLAVCLSSIPMYQAGRLWASRVVTSRVLNDGCGSHIALQRSCGRHERYVVWDHRPFVHPPMQLSR